LLDREDSRRYDRRADRVEAALDDTPAHRGVPSRAKRWITAHVLDLDALDDPVPSRLERKRRQRAHDRRWDPTPLDPFADRCPATIARSSGGDEDCRLDSGLGKRGRDLATIPCAIGQALVIAGRAAVEVGDAFDRTLELELAHGVERQHEVGVLARDHVEEP